MPSDSIAPPAAVPPPTATPPATADRLRLSALTPALTVMPSSPISVRSPPFTTAPETSTVAPCSFSNWPSAPPPLMAASLVPSSASMPLVLPPRSIPTPALRVAIDTVGAAMVVPPMMVSESVSNVASVPAVMVPLPLKVIEALLMPRLRLAFTLLLYSVSPLSLVSEMSRPERLALPTLR